MIKSILRAAMTTTAVAMIGVGSLGLAASPPFPPNRPSRSAARRCIATKNIVENAVNSKDHTTLVAAVKAADLVDTLDERRPVHRVRAGQ